MWEALYELLRKADNIFLNRTEGKHKQHKNSSCIYMKKQKNILFCPWYFIGLSSASFFYLKKHFTMPVYKVKYSKYLLK